MSISPSSSSAHRRVEYFHVLMADRKIEIECRFRWVFRQCRNYLASFDTPDYVVHLSKADFLQSAESVPIPPHEKDVLLYPAPNIVESHAVYQKMSRLLLSEQILQVHAAAISVNGQAFLFTAPSGTGKTTHVHNWLKMIPNTCILNGDKPLVDAAAQRVYGTPWAGKEREYSNASAPLAAIIRLERGNVNTIHRISFLEMLPLLLEQTYLPTEGTLALQAYQAVNLLRNVPCYRLSCTMDPESALVAHRGLIQ